MSKYDKIRGLVEEVRGILHLDVGEEQQEAREAIYQEAADEVVSEIFSEARVSKYKGMSKGLKGKFKKSTPHGPFKRLQVGKRIGKGPRGRRVAKRGYWKCRKQGAYTQVCVGSKGERKKVRISKSYKKTYNKIYRRWAAGGHGKVSAAARAGMKARRAG